MTARRRLEAAALWVEAHTGRLFGYSAVVIGLGLLNGGYTRAGFGLVAILLMAMSSAYDTDFSDWSNEKRRG